MFIPMAAQVHKCAVCLQRCVPMVHGDMYRLPDGRVVNLIVCYHCHRTGGSEAYLVAAARGEALKHGWHSVSWTDATPGDRVFRLGHRLGRYIVSGPFTVVKRHVLKNPRGVEFKERGEVLLVGEADE